MSDEAVALIVAGVFTGVCALVAGLGAPVVEAWVQRRRREPVRTPTEPPTRRRPWVAVLAAAAGALVGLAIAAVVLQQNGRQIVPPGAAAISVFEPCVAPEPSPGMDQNYVAIHNCLLMPINVYADDRLLTSIAPMTDAVVALPGVRNSVTWQVPQPTPNGQPCGDVLEGDLPASGGQAVSITNVVAGRTFSFHWWRTSRERIAGSTSTRAHLQSRGGYPATFALHQAQTLTAYYMLSDSANVSASCPGKFELAYGWRNPGDALLSSQVIQGSGLLVVPVPA